MDYYKRGRDFKKYVEWAAMQMAEAYDKRQMPGLEGCCSGIIKEGVRRGYDKEDVEKLVGILQEIVVRKVGGGTALRLSFFPFHSKGVELDGTVRGVVEEALDYFERIHVT